MDITVYTLPNCSACSHLKELMDRAKQSYNKIEIGTDISLEDFQKEYSDVGMLPYVIIDGEKIGGLVEVAKKFLTEGLVKPPQK
jgi:glutaredoxin 3